MSWTRIPPTSTGCTSPEPRTPEGEVYATDAFAALLALQPASGLTCEYVGRVTTAKDFETIPMYRIADRAGIAGS